MKIILVYVASLDGRTTKWDQLNIHDWVSKEDQQHFRNILKKSSVLVMGSNTFEQANAKPAPGTLRIVLTRNPGKYKRHVVPGQMEFTNETPAQLVDRLEKEGYKQITLVSGQGLTTEFFKAGLVDELWLTIEPKLFGTGNGIIKQEKMNVDLQLISLKKLNKKGTLLATYKIIKP